MAMQIGFNKDDLTFKLTGNPKVFNPSIMSIRVCLFVYNNIYYSVDTFSWEMEMQNGFHKGYLTTSHLQAHELKGALQLLSKRHM